MKLFYKEVFLTESLSELSAVEDLLIRNRIPMKRKSINRTFYGMNTLRPMLGTVGEDLSLETQYYLYVPKNRKEEAEHLIHHWRCNK